MKKLILFLLLSIPLFAQTKEVNGGLYWADSLYIDYTGVADSSDTISVLDMGFGYDWLTITAIDTGSVLTDSIVVEEGTLIYSADTLNPGTAWQISDTLWSPVNFMRDSTWTNANVIASAGGNITYQVYVANYELIRVRMTNVEGVGDRVWRFYAVLNRKK